MDNNSDFEQQFKQNLNATAPATAPAQPVLRESTGGSKLPLVIAIALAAVTLVESIVLLITLTNYFSYLNDMSEGDTAITPEDDSYLSSIYTYDNNDHLVAMNLTCKAEDGAYYVFTTEKKFEQHNTTGAVTSSGTYTITNDSLISIPSANGTESKTLYYDGFDVADELTIYECEENVTETGVENAETE